MGARSEVLKTPVHEHILTVPPLARPYSAQHYLAIGLSRACGKAIHTAMQAVAAMEEKKDFSLPQKRQQEPPPQRQEQPQQQRRGLFTGKQPVYNSSKAREPVDLVPGAEKSSRSALSASAMAAEGPTAESPGLDAATNPFASPSEISSNPFLTTAAPQIAAPPTRASGMSDNNKSTHLHLELSIQISVLGLMLHEPVLHSMIDHP